MHKYLFNELSTKIYACSKCFKNHKNQPVLDKYKENAKYIVISEMPGSQHSSQKVFPGPVNKLIRDALVLSGFLREDFYFTNITKCNTRNSFCSKNLCIDNCAPYLDEELQIINPSIVFTLGEKVFQIINGQSAYSYSSLIGKRVFIKGMLVFPLPHPQLSLTSPSFLEDFQNSFRYIKNAMME